MNPYDDFTYGRRRYFTACDQRRAGTGQAAASRSGAALANARDAEREALEQQLASVTAALTRVSNDEYHVRILIKTLLDLTAAPADDGYTAKVLRCELIKYLAGVATRACVERDTLRAKNIANPGV